MKIQTTGDGSHTVESTLFKELYHSRHGAITESRTVFIEAGLKCSDILKSPIHILEIGMGTGLNVLLTALEPSTQNISIDYTAYELYPISADQAAQLNYHELLQEENTRETFMQIHSIPWGTFTEIRPGFRLCKLQKPFQALNDEAQFDLIYMDAFAPEAQPEFWEAPFTDQLFKALKPGGILVTYCAKGNFKRALKTAGFLIEALPGPPGKREMTRGRKGKKQ